MTNGLTLARRLVRRGEGRGLTARTRSSATPPEAARRLYRSTKPRSHFMTAKFPARIAVLAALAISVVGCGYNRGDRALSGGLLGAGGGVILGAAAFGNPAAGALIGG